MADTAVRLIVTGRVQGVGYRWWASAAARRLGLRGWVRNRSDGSVELLLIGAANLIDQMAAACADGPDAARPDGVVRAPTQDDGAQGFEERPTL
jgi:acylphosphatase